MIAFKQCWRRRCPSLAGVEYGVDLTLYPAADIQAHITWLEKRLKRLDADRYNGGNKTP